MSPPPPEVENEVPLLVHGKNNGNALACSFLLVSQSFRKQGPLKQSQIEGATAFSSRLVAHTFCAAQLFSSTSKLSPAWCHLALGEVWRVH